MRTENQLASDGNPPNHSESSEHKNYSIQVASDSYSLNHYESQKHRIVAPGGFRMPLLDHSGITKRHTEMHVHGVTSSG